MRRYTASISVSYTEDGLRSACAIDEEKPEPVSEDEAKRYIGENLFEIIQDMVLRRQPFAFDFKVKK